MAGEFSVGLAKKRQIKEAEPGMLAALMHAIPTSASTLDFGAGNGRYVAALRKAGYRSVVGYDGTDGINELTGGLVQRVDLAIDRTTWNAPCLFDWVYCLEVGEHIPGELLPVFLCNLCGAATQGLIVSWATVGQRGRGHVSCRSPEWVANQCGIRSWGLDSELTARCRELAGGGWKKKLLVFQ